MRFPNSDRQRLTARKLNRFAILLILAGGGAAADDAPPGFECRWAEQPPTIDGKPDEDVWAKAQTIDRFTLPWLGDDERPAKTSTRARLLWDREHLYFYAEMEDADLYADVTEHDGQTWLNDVFELFFKPADDKPGYYEFQVNAAGTRFDMFVPRRGAGGVRRFAEDREFHVEAKAVLRGTLNKWTDDDEGWSVEGRIPWTDLLATGGRPDAGETWKFALCRYDYSVDFEGPELSTCAPLKSKRAPDFHLHEDYAPLKFVGPEGSTALKPFGIGRRTPLVTSNVSGSPDPPPPYRAVRALEKLSVDWPVFVICEPGSRRLIYIDQYRPYTPTRVRCSGDDPAEGTAETLLEMEDAAYSICFHPEYAENGWLYIGSNGARGEEPKKSRVTRYTIRREPPFDLLPDSALEVIAWKSDGHNGAAVTFGNDGMLYVTTGDGTSDSDDDVVGQRMDLLLGKVLRIDVDHPGKDRAYSVPGDNPFAGREDAREETWAYGLRNPWRITTDPVRGEIWVGNNGQDLWEQIYLVRRGANYGWSVYEGSHPFYLARESGPTPHVKPTLEHPHSEARSLTGGVVYYGEKLPELHGAYIYGDYSTGKIWAAKTSSGEVSWHREIADTPLQITGFGLDAEGELLICDHHEGGGFYTLVPNDHAHDPAAFPRTISESGLFRSAAGHVVAEGMIPYSVNSPLWSDGAYKERYIALPESGGDDGSPPRIGFSERGAWELPEGTVLVKSFGLEMEKGRPDTRRWIETRFLTRQQGEWVGYSYAWNEEQTEAALVAGEGSQQTFEIRGEDGSLRRQAWRFPSRTECMVCHSRAAGFVLGLNTPQMNRDHDYGGVRDNQLRELEHLGLFRVDWRPEAIEREKKRLAAEGMEKKAIDRRIAAITATSGQRTAGNSHLLAAEPAEYERLADPDDESMPLEDRARSYLHANCAQCHVKAGGGNAQIELGRETALESMNVLDVPPLHHRFDVPGARLIAPGRPDRSILLHRMSIRGNGQMPQLATSRVDEEAVELIAEWIRSLGDDK